MNKNELLERSLVDLEFPEVLNIISKFTYSEKAEEEILELRPILNSNDINSELDLIDEMIELIENEENLSFQGFSDQTTLFKKSLIGGAVLSTDEVLDIQDLIVSSRRIKNYFMNVNQVFPNLIRLSQSLYSNKNLERHINEVIDQNGEIKDNASNELFRIRKELKEKSARLRKRVQKILAKSIDVDVAQDDFVTIREDRFVIPIKASNKRTFGGIIHGVSQTGQTVFLEPNEIIDMNNDLSLLKNEEKREIYRLLEALTKEISEDAYSFIKAIEVLAHLDTIHARARFALEFGLPKPKITDTNNIILNNMRHPLLVKKLGVKEVVPLSAEMNDEIKGYVISGPNAGGKTVALKTIGLSVALACSGIYPMGELICNPREIFTSIGDNQSIENDLSTFSSQISQIKDIVENAGNDSLVLIDEICSGTDPHEGSALASGIMDTFLDYNIDFVTTTHQSSLKNYALNNKQIKNASLEFDEENLKPTYKFLSGIPGSSYAFNLAKSLGLNEMILKRSEKYTFEGQLDLEKSITELNKARKEAIKARNDAEAYKKQNIELEQKLKEKLSDFHSKKDNLIQKAKSEAAEIVSDANKLIENTIREIKENEKDVKHVRKEFVNKKKEIVKQSKKESSESSLLPNEPIEVGDNVVMKDSDEIGSVLEIDGKLAQVEFNGLKFKVKLNKLIKSKKQKKEEKTIHHVSDHIKFDAKMNIDIRGERVEAALPRIDKHISDSVAGGLHEVIILHGKGTGVLRSAIREFLDGHYLVKNYREGDLVEGGSGVTIVEL